MLRIILFDLLLLSVVFLAFRRGDLETRVASMIALAATALTAFSVLFLGAGEPVETMVAIVDVTTLIAFVLIALRSHRFWPLWIAGLQLTTVLAHLFRVISPDLVNIAYQTAMRFWSYPILFILAVAVWRTQRYEALQPTPA